MATNTGKNHRNGSVTGRSQFKNTQNGEYMKRNDATGRIMAGKVGGKPF